MKIRKFPILVIIVLVTSFSNCIILQRVAGGTVDLNENSAVQYRLIFLVKSDFCTVVEKTNKKCLKFGNPGWYPVDFVRSKYIRFSDYYDPKLHKLIFNIPTYLLENYGFEKNRTIVYRPKFTLNAFSKIPKKNAILVRLRGSSRGVNATSYASIFSLLLIPGYFEFRLNTDILLYNASGKEITVIEENEKYLQLWIGWIFFLWGKVVSDDYENLLITKINESVSSKNHFKKD